MGQDTEEQHGHKRSRDSLTDSPREIQVLGLGLNTAGGGWGRWGWSGHYSLLAIPALTPWGWAHMHLLGR